jgi:VIT1/CCC1 family predicted Fe2+/Mn2+ transporter
VTDNTDNWFHERESAWLYRRLAEVEPDRRKKELFISLATAAERQAERWEHSGVTARAFSPTLRAHIVGWLLRTLGPKPLKPALAALKLRGLSIYDDTHPLGRLPGHPMPTSVEQIGLSHKRMSGGNLRAAVFGVNDGLVSNTSLIMGVAGAGADHTFLLTSGVAGLLAGALSMAAGEYVSVRSQREMYEYQIGLERDELAEYPEEEAEELALIYSARGMPLEQAREMGRQLLKNPEHALATLAREELGLNPDDLGSPWGAAMFSFVSFAAGALLPLLPFIFGAANTHALPLAALISALALLIVGMAISLFTGRSAWRSGARMVLIGAGAALTTWVIGRLLGVAAG